MTGRSGWFAMSTLVFACADLRPPPSWAEPASVADAQASMAAEPATAKVDADRFGVGWLERDGVFHSYNERVRFRRPPGWELLVDDLVALGLPDAGSGLIHFEDDVVIYFILERDVEESPEAYRALRRERTLARFEAEHPEPPMTGTFAGRELMFDSVSGGPLDKDYLFGVHFIEDHEALQIVVWYPRAGDREALRERAREMLARVELLTPGEVESIRAELARGPDTQNQVAPSWSLRRGVFRDFEHDFTWTSPSRDWVVHAGKLAELHEFGATLVLRNRMARLVGTLTVHDDPRLAASDGESFHEFMVARLIDGGMRPSGVRRTMNLGHDQALIQSVTYEPSGLPARYEVATVTNGSLGLVWFLGGPTHSVEANLALIDTVIRNTRIEAELIETRMDGSRFIDQRLGYSLELPPGYQRMVGQLDAEEGNELTGWMPPEGGASVMLTVQAWACTGLTQDEVIEAAARGLIEASGPPTSRRSGSLDGERGEHLHWQGRGDLLLVNRDRTMYGLLVESSDPDLFAQLREGFAFVD